MGKIAFVDRTEYSSGGHSVTVWLDGSIKVKSGDSLSKYSMAIYGDFKNMDRFRRPDGRTFKPIENLNVIYANETLYHADVVESTDTCNETGLFTNAQMDQFLVDTGIVSRVAWKALPPVGALQIAPYYDTIVIHHAGNHSYYYPLAVQIRHFVEYADIGYHFMITKDGTIYEGRRLLYTGAHVEMQNTGKIGIMLDGCFEPNTIGGYIEVGQVPPSPAQLAMLHKLISAVMRFVRTPQILGGHLDFKATECPGQLLYPLLPLYRLAYGLRKPVGSSQPV